MKKRCTPVDNMAVEWELRFKPQILTCRTVPIKLLAEVLDCSVEKVQVMLVSDIHAEKKQHTFGVAREGSVEYSYDVYPLRFIAWYAHNMLVKQADGS